MSIATRPVQRTGPAIVVDCGHCEGVGVPGCPQCHGTGRNVYDIHPFGTLECIAEHVGSIRAGLKIPCDETGHKMGTPGYHLTALDGYVSSLFNQLVYLLPEEFARTEGE